MPKLIIEITEKEIPMPGESNEPIVGYETGARIELCEGDHGEMLTALHGLLPAIQLAISTAMQAVLGPAALSGYGTVEDHKEQAIAICRQNRSSEDAFEWKWPGRL